MHMTFRTPRKNRLGLFAGLLLTFGVVALMSVSAAMATSTITWDGNGVTNGVLDSEKCGENADFGHGDPNGLADPNDYLKWVLTQASGVTSASITISGGGAANGTYDGYPVPGGGVWHFVTPSFTPLDSAVVTVVVTYAGSLGGNPQLTISNGCPGKRPPAADLTVSKDAEGSYDKRYTWDIEKSVDRTEITERFASTVTANYTVVVSNTGSEIENVQVNGTITVNNPNLDNVEISDLTDVLHNADNSFTEDCTVDGEFPATIPAEGSSDFDYTCELDALPTEDVFNTAEVCWDEQTLDSHSTPLEADCAEFTTGPIEFTETEVDTCIDVTDTFGSDAPAPLNPATVCLDDLDAEGKYSYEYSRDLDVPAAGTCVTYDNTAAFETHDTGTTGEDSASVRVCHPADGCTPGYWKNNLAGWSATGYATTDTLGGVGFTNTGRQTSTLLAALGFRGGSTVQGAKDILMRAAVAALLNAAHPSIHYPLTVDQVKTMVNDALASGNRATILALAATLDGYNNLGCTIDAHGRPINP
jgi:hypothetical protein